MQLVFHVNIKIYFSYKFWFPKIGVYSNDIDYYTVSANCKRCHRYIIKRHYLLTGCINQKILLKTYLFVIVLSSENPQRTSSVHVPSACKTDLSRIAWRCYAKLC